MCASVLKQYRVFYFLVVNFAPHACMRTLPGMRSREEKETSSTLERFPSTPRTTTKQQIETRSESTIVIAL